MSTAVVVSRQSGGVSLFRPGAIDRYFQSHRSFEYTPSAEASVLKSFKRLAINQKWDENRRVQEKKKFQAAVDAEFTARVGNGFALIDWQRLAKVIGIEPLPQSITQCRKMIKRENINIYHILHAYRRAREIQNIDDIRPSTEIQRFKSVGELRRYTQKHGMFYSKEQAKGSVLKGLLKHLR
ncbi:hypothetical protein TWF730_011116 [Orbilia blumenaviensis]|uniref:Uncharacterized protein n=1 Tax=Orbilia blumenaviensis TaxID=1796055 RepID=A0AAV9UJH0_9PEZI